MNSNDKILQEKRKKLAIRYKEWLKKNRFYYYIALIIYVVLLIFSTFIPISKNIKLAFSLIIFAYSIYIISLHWYTNKYLLLKLHEKVDI